MPAPQTATIKSLRVISATLLSDTLVGVLGRPLIISVSAFTHRTHPELSLKLLPSLTVLATSVDAVQMVR